jgi:hypothetical protein
MFGSIIFDVWKWIFHLFKFFLGTIAYLPPSQSAPYKMFSIVEDYAKFAINLEKSMASGAKAISKEYK